MLAICHQCSRWNCQRVGGWDCRRKANSANRYEKNEWIKYGKSKLDVEIPYFSPRSAIGRHINGELRGVDDVPSGFPNLRIL